MRGRARSNSSPLLLGLASAALFGAATPTSKLLLGELSSAQLAGLLYLGAALGTLPAALVGGRKRPDALGAKGARYLSGAVLLGGIAGPLLLLTGLSLSPAASTSLILNLELAATALLGVLFFREHLHRSGALAVAGIVLSGVMVSAGGGRPGIEGGLLVALACLCWGLDNHWTALIDALTPAQTTCLKGLVAGAFNLVLGLYLAPLHASTLTLFAALGVGACCYGLSIMLYVEAAQRLGPTRAQSLFASAPFLGAGLSLALLGEPLSIWHGLGGALLALCVVLLLKAQHAHVHQHEPLWHVHLHTHDDGHHDHAHDEASGPGVGPHSHWHQHEATTHAHPHVPDLHHRHKH